MNRLRDLAFLAVVVGVAAYQGRQLHIYAATGQAPATTQNAGPSHGGNPAAPAPAAVAACGSLFQQNCAFCHGRDAAGGETGPDLTRSKLVSADVGGDKIGMLSCTAGKRKECPPLVICPLTRLPVLSRLFTPSRSKRHRPTVNAEESRLPICKPGMWRLERLTLMALEVVPAATRRPATWQVSPTDIRACSSKSGCSIPGM